MAVYELGKLLKISERKIIRAIGSYTGAWRRMEFRGEISSIKVFDDYAHHPTEIKATLQAFREKFPRAPLVCVFQPHQTKRLEALFKEFVSAFNDASALILLPLYSVAGRDQASSKFTARYLAGAISKKYPERMIFYTENPKHIQKTLRTVLDFFPPSPAPVVIMMGAGNIVQYTDILIGAK
jgi:UDP-N-acetylmuramate--alanine ligase